MTCHECKSCVANFGSGEMRCGHPASTGQRIPTNEIPDWCPIIHTLPSDDPVGDRIKALEDRVAKLEARLESLAGCVRTQPIPRR